MSFAPPNWLSSTQALHFTVIDISSFVSYVLDEIHTDTLKKLDESKNTCWLLHTVSYVILKEVRYNCSAHRSAHLFIIARSSHSHIKRKQPQRIFLKYCCSVTVINIPKKHLRRKTHELYTYIRSPDDS